MAETLRLDVWLWRARFFKTRTLAADHIRGHGLRLSHNGQTRRIDKPSVTIAQGDVVTLARGAHISSIEILDLGTRRGPPAEAQALYRLLEGGSE
ncbi:MAG TPA: RNA-binding S4 domain-containing protein [Hyphomonas sp.]|nr:RNA-binding S4 domain-containing protein [Hyphomonas sp.]